MVNTVWTAGEMQLFLCVVDNFLIIIVLKGFSVDDDVDRFWDSFPKKLSNQTLRILRHQVFQVRAMSY